MPVMTARPMNASQLVEPDVLSTPVVYVRQNTNKIQTSEVKVDFNKA